MSVRNTFCQSYFRFIIKTYEPPDYTSPYVVFPKSNENDFFAQRRRAWKEKWGSRRVEGKPRYTV